MKRVTGMIAAVAAMGLAAPALAQSYDGCASAARDAETAGRNDCARLPRLTQGRCFERVSATHARALNKCVADENRRIQTASAKAAREAEQARARAARRQ